MKRFRKNLKHRRNKNLGIGKYKVASSTETLTTYSIAGVILLIGLLLLVYTKYFEPERFLSDKAELGSDILVKSSSYNNNLLLLLIENIANTNIHSLQINATGCNYDKGAISNISFLAVGKRAAAVFECNSSTLTGNKFKTSTLTTYITKTQRESIPHTEKGSIIITAGNDRISYSSQQDHEEMPEISISLVNPTTDIDVQKNQFFIFTVNVSCEKADCGEIEVSLDPSSCPGEMTGTGTLDDPCMVTTCTQLAAINQNLLANYTLANSFDCSSTYPGGFPQICSGGGNFMGTLDGQGYNITGIKIAYQYFSRSGLIRNLGENATIKDLHLYFTTVQGSTDHVGALVGYNYGNIIRCSVQVNSQTVGGTGGGIAAVNEITGVIDQCFANITSLTGNHKALICGHNNGIINNSWSLGSVGGSGCTAGIVHNNYGTIANSFTIANANGNGDCGRGGISGQCNGNGNITNSFFVGNISGGGPIGGITGYDDASCTINNSFYYNISNPTACTGRNAGVINCSGVTEFNYFFNPDNEPSASWDKSIWHFNGIGLPSLAWQVGGPSIDKIECDITGSDGWVDCNAVGYGNTIYKIRDNCSDPRGATVVSASFRLVNVPDSHTFFDGSTTTYANNWWVYDNNDTTITDSGQWQARAGCTNDLSITGMKTTSWLVQWGTISAELLLPSSSINVTQNATFTASSRVSCSSGECGTIRATLDPELEPYNFDFEYDLQGWTNAGGSQFSQKNNVCGNDLGSGALVGDQCDYGYSYDGEIRSPALDLSSIKTATIDFNGWQYDEAGGCYGSYFDGNELSISTDGENWENIKCNIGDNSAAWNSYSYDISSYARSTVYLRLRYATMDGCCGNENGIAIDNIRIHGEPANDPPSINSLYLSKNVVGLNQTVTCSADITEPESEGIIYTKFSVKDGENYPLINNEEASINGNIRSSETFVTTTAGIWNCSVRTADVNAQESTRYITFVPGYKGAVPMYSGEPFYTNSDNPTSCPDMKAGDTCDSSWTVNATGDLNTSWAMYSIYNATTYSSYVEGAVTGSAAVTIVANTSTVPVVHLISPGNNTDSSTLLHTFSCNMSDTHDISSLELYIWNYSDNSTVFTETAIASANPFTKSWGYTLDGLGTYIWNCKGYNMEGYSSWNSEGNYTLTVDLKQGLIPTTPGSRPFYTTAASNPVTISLDKGESTLVTFMVNATGGIDTSYGFFAYANITSNKTISARTNNVNIRIVS